MKTLDEIAIHHQTDKASQFSRTYAKPHDYCRHLELFFAPMRDRPIKLLEIGVGGGESIQTWLEYFPNAQVVGIDIVRDTNPWNSTTERHHPRYKFFCGNQGSFEFWQKFVSVNTTWDIIIDDGSHVANDIINTFYALWPYLKSGGIYEVEDLKSAPGASVFFQPKLLNLPTGYQQADSVYFADELVIVKKK